MVEETTAATHSLRKEADDLAGLVGAFRIAGIKEPVIRAGARRAQTPPGAKARRRSLLGIS